MNAPPVAGSLTSLCIHESFFGTKSLKTLFLSTPNLEILHLHYPVLARVVATYGHHLNVPEVIETFAPFRKTLRELKISTALDFRENGIYSQDPPGILGNASSLKGFPALQRLEIPMPVLLGWESDTAPVLGDVRIHVPPSIHFRRSRC